MPGAGEEREESHETRLRGTIYTVHYKVISIIFHRHHPTLKLYNILSSATQSSELKTKERATKHTSINVFKITIRLEEIAL